MADPILLAPMVDAVLLVVDGSKSRRGDITDARQQLDRVGARLIGTVINRFRLVQMGPLQILRSRIDASGRAQPLRSSGVPISPCSKEARGKPYQ